jgi:serine/threonine protein kinase
MLWISTQRKSRPSHLWYVMNYPTLLLERYIQLSKELLFSIFIYCCYCKKYTLFRILYILGTYNSLVLSLLCTSSGEISSINWDTRFKIIKGICQGLHFLHSIKELDGSLVHMNLVPNSIWLDDNWVPKIADFGLSRLFGKEQTRMYTVNVKGQK